jgi:hypothetical protein
MFNIEAKLQQTTISVDLTINGWNLSLLRQRTENTCVFRSTCILKKSLKIPKGQSESVNRRRTDTMTKKKKYKRTNNDQENIHIKLKIELNSGTPEESAVPAPLVTPVVLI